MRGRSENPNLEKLDRIAEVLKVGRDWLRDGVGDVEGDEPALTNPDDVYVAVPYATVKPAMGGGATVEIEPDHGKPYHFQKSWITHGLRADPAKLRIMHVVGDSMEPTLRDGDIVLVDMGRAVPTPPGVFVLHDGIGLVAKRLEHIPNSDPPVMHVISDNKTYSAYERTADEVNKALNKASPDARGAVKTDRVDLIACDVFPSSIDRLQPLLNVISAHANQQLSDPWSPGCSF